MPASIKKGIAIRGKESTPVSPVIILGGIYSGKFTPTEAAVISVVYSYIVGRFVYKELDRDSTTGRRIGARMMVAGMLSTRQPTTNRNRLMS